MPSIPIGSGTLHYREAGQGPDVLVLLHAFPLHSGMWEPQLRALAPSFHLLAPDWRGLGASRPTPDASTMELLAGDVVDLLRALGIRRAAFAGLSMGGYVALELYRRAPGLFRGLALCDTKAPADTPEAAATREAFAANALAKGIGWVADEFAPKLLRERADPAHLATARGLILSNDPAGVAAAQRGMARRPDSVPTLRKIRCPAVAIVGAEDRLTPLGESQRIAQTIPGARLETIPAAAHLSNVEAPDAFNTALARFCTALPA
jgi:pimeloyl-ACP methyl ester carboxylesterase